MVAQANERNAVEAALCQQSRESKKRHEKFLCQSEARWYYD